MYCNPSSPQWCPQTNVFRVQEAPNHFLLFWPLCALGLDACRKFSETNIPFTFQMQLGVFSAISQICIECNSGLSQDLGQKDVGSSYWVLCSWVCNTHTPIAVSGSLNVKMEFYWADDHWCYSSSSLVTDFVHGIDCSAICVDCFQAGDHRDHDYGTFAHQICTLSFLPIILTKYSWQKKMIHWFWQSDEPYFVVIQHTVFVLFGWNWYNIDLVTLHVLLEFLSAIIYMYIRVCLNSVSKTLWLECSHVSQWVWRVLWLWGQRCLEDIRVSTTLMVEH